MKKRIFLIFSVILILFVIYIYTHIGAHHQNNQRLSARKAIPVSVDRVQQETVMIPFHAIGNVQPYSTVVIKSLVDGELLAVNFHEGDFVKKDQLLFSIDPRPLANQLHQAEANLERDQAQYNNAHLQYQRNQSLLIKNYISRQDYDQLKANQKALGASVTADQAALENAKLQLSYASITAPIDGRTGSLQVNVGNIIKTANNTTLVSINQINPIYVTFSLPQQYLSNIQHQLIINPVKVIAHVNGYHEEGRLSFIDNNINTTTGTIQLKAVFDNKDQHLWPGQFVNVTLLSTKIPNMLLIPSSAVQVGQNGSYVFVVNPNHTVSYRTVKLGSIIGERTTIIEGLKPNQLIVTDGQMRLVDGAHIMISKSSL